jgi:hypothetical protein
MQSLVKLLVVFMALFAFLLSDVGEAIPVAQPEARITEDDGQKVARRRKKRRRRRKSRPKPPPPPEPAAEEPATAPVGAGGGGGPSLRRTTRIEFDAQLIKGQTTKAGEVQILERKDTELKSMVKRRTSFREEIIHTVFPEK